MINLAEIKASDNARKIDPKAVDTLAESINKVGLIQPITVRTCDDGGYQLVAGHHRVHAMRKLGLTQCRATVLEPFLNDLEIELMEIDENLCRSEYSPAMRAQKIQRRKEIWTLLRSGGGQGHQESGKNFPTTGRGNTQFAAETASATGQSKRAINMDVSRADALGEQLVDVVGTSLDKGVELDALKSMPSDQRSELIRQAKAGEIVTARPAQPTPQPKPQPSEADALREQLSEMAVICDELKSDMDSVSAALAAEDPLGAALREAKMLREQLRVLELRVQSLTGEKAEAVRMAKHWKSKFDRLEKARGSAIPV